MGSAMIVAAAGDRAAAEALVTALRARAEAAVAPQPPNLENADMRAGAEAAIESAGAVVLLLSQNAVDAPWIRFAAETAQAKGAPLIPVLLDGAAVRLLHITGEAAPIPAPSVAPFDVERDLGALASRIPIGAEDLGAGDLGAEDLSAGDLGAGDLGEGDLISGGDDSSPPEPPRAPDLPSARGEPAGAADPQSGDGDAPGAMDEPPPRSGGLYEDAAAALRQADAATPESDDAAPEPATRQDLDRLQVPDSLRAAEAARAPDAETRAAAVRAASDHARAAMKREANAAPLDAAARDDLDRARAAQAAALDAAARRRARSAPPGAPAPDAAALETEPLSLDPLPLDTISATHRSPTPPAPAPSAPEPLAPEPLAPEPSAAHAPPPSAAAFRAAHLFESIPRRMRVGRPQQITVRISRREDGGEGMPGPARRHAILAASAMTVTLDDPSVAYAIRPLTAPTQWIDRQALIGLGLPDQPAEWRWSVEPLKTGVRPLRIRASARVADATGHSAEASLPDQEIEVRVGVDPARAAGALARWTLFAAVAGVLGHYSVEIIELARAFTDPPPRG
ncbi:MAG: TIR domain-containing protein [Pseudomonadota bacterium]